jgi:hypothetical protein
VEVGKVQEQSAHTGVERRLEAIQESPHSVQTRATPLDTIWETARALPLESAVANAAYDVTGVPLRLALRAFSDREPASAATSRSGPDLVTDLTTTRPWSSAKRIWSVRSTGVPC